jgi:DNA adenine methylase
MTTDASVTAATTPRLTPLFPHPGGKTRLLRHILPHVPPHRQYVEPFCGALAVFLAKEPVPVEVINDADGDMMACYRYATHHPDALIAELARWPGASRENFALLRQNPG